MESKIFTEFKVDGLNVNPCKQAVYHYEFDKNTIVIVSCLDTLKLTDIFLASYTDLRKKDLYVYAECLIIAADLKFKNIFLSVKSLIISNDITLDVSGQRGEATHDSTGDTAKEGVAGGNSGNVFITIENIDYLLKNNSNIVVLANGGEGGDNAKGKGGAGGDGGKVDILVSHPVVDLIDTLKSSYANKKVDRDRLTDLIIRLENYQDKDITDQAVELRKMLDFRKKLLDQYDETYNSFKLWKDNQQSRYSYVIHGGAGLGTEGSGSAPGKDGIARCDTLRLGDTENMERLAVIHPLQCAMLLNRAVMEFAFLPNRLNYKPLEELFSTLYARTKPFKKFTENSIKIPSNLTSASICSTLKNVKFFQNVNDEAKRYLGFLENSCDVCGYAPNYVPLIPVKEMKKQYLDPLINQFKVINDAYNTLTDRKIAEDKKRGDALAQMLASAKKAMVSDTQKAILRNDISRSVEYIKQSEQALPPMKEALENLLDQFKDAVKRHFHFKLESLLGALSTIAFAPDSVMMWATQGAQLIAGGLRNTSNDMGVEVRDDYIIKQVDDAKLDVKYLAENYKTSKDDRIVLEDPGAAKLVAQQASLNKLLNDFYLTFPTEIDAVKQAFKEYVDAVLRRNTEILNYNTSLELLAKAEQDNSQAKLDMEKLNQLQQGAISISELDNLLESVSIVYFSMRYRFIRTILLTEKAFTLSHLKRVKIFGEQILQIDEVTANIISNDLDSALFENQLAHSINPSPFSKEVYWIDGSRLSNFKKTGYKTFTIDHEDLKSHPESTKLKNLRNIRISEMYIRIKGIKPKVPSDSRVFIDIRHGREDTLISDDGLEMTLSHEPLNQSFEYNLNNEQEVTDHAKFSFGEDEFKDTSLIGPFSEWTIRLPDYHKFNLEGVDRIEVEFEGFHG